MSEEEFLVQVDENDRIIGKVVRSSVFTDKGMYFRVAQILVFNSKGEVILHQRSKNKIKAPLKWDVFGGHNKFGDTIEQTAYNETREECGIKNFKLKFIYKYLYRTEKQSKFKYIYTTTSDGPYLFDKDEVEKVEAFNVKRLLNHEYDSRYNILPQVYEFIDKVISKNYV